LSPHRTRSRTAPAGIGMVGATMTQEAHGGRHHDKRMPCGPREARGRQAHSWPSRRASASSSVPEYAPVDRYFQPASATMNAMSARCPALRAYIAFIVADAGWKYLSTG